MKKQIFTLACLLVCASAGAQTMYDGLIFSQNNYVGTARTLSMGNAFTALGADGGSFQINPAGSAVSKRFLLTVSGGFNTSIAVAQGTALEGKTYAYGDRLRTSKSEASLPNVAFIASFNNRNGSALKRVSVGISYNATDYYLDNVYASGNHYGTSLTGFFAANTSAHYNDIIANTAYDNYAWDAVVAAQGGMISNVDWADNEYVGATEKYNDKKEFFTAGPLSQKYGRMTTGGKADVVFNLAFDINDWIYFGASLGVQDIEYKNDYYLKESAVDPADFDIAFDRGTTNFNSLKYNYSYGMAGTGIYGKFGVILTPGKILRIGASIQTPTAVSVSEWWAVSGETKFSNSSFDSSASSPKGSQTYKLKAPWRGTLGIAATLGGKAIVSADWEFAAFGSMRFRQDSYDKDESAFNAVNGNIRDCMGAQHNLRLGAEYKPADWFAIRAGYNLLSSPVFKEYDAEGNLYKLPASVSNSVSLGLGFQASWFTFDLALRSLFQPAEYIMPYGDYLDNKPSPEIRSKKALLSGVVTLGFKF